MISPDLKAVAENPELVARMVAFVRDVAEHCVVTSHQTRRWWNDANAIAADLPKPIDPDLLEARKLAASMARKVGATDAAKQIENGTIAPDGEDGAYTRTNKAFVDLALTALKRGRALSERSRTEAERG